MKVSKSLLLGTIVSFVLLSLFVCVLSLYEYIPVLLFGYAFGLSFIMIAFDLDGNKDQHIVTRHATKMIWYGIVSILMILNAIVDNIDIMLELILLLVAIIEFIDNGKSAGLTRKRIKKTSRRG